VLQRAAESHDADATLALGATYDPLVLRELKVYGFGFAGDLALARAWYEKARDDGSPDAMRRLERLANAK
jgi:TPR repeat protein